jgi:hypothetical protein
MSYKKRPTARKASLEDPIVFNVNIFETSRLVDELLPLFRHAHTCSPFPSNDWPPFAMEAICSRKYDATATAGQAIQTLGTIATELEQAAKSIRTLYTQMHALGMSSPRQYTPAEWKKMKADMLENAALASSTGKNDEKEKGCQCRCGSEHPSKADVEAHNKRLEDRIAALEEEVQALQSGRGTPTSTIYSVADYT